MQAIQTKYVGQRSVRGSRIVARYGKNKITITYDHACTLEENHCNARDALITKLTPLGWKLPDNRPVVGQLPDGSYAHVFAGKV